MINFFKQRKKQYLVVDVDEQRLSCGLFEVKPCSKEKPILLSYKVFNCDYGEILGGVVMNPTRIRDFLISCVKVDSSRRLPVFISLSPTVMQLDTYLPLPSSIPDIDRFKQVVAASINWDYLYVGSIDEFTHLFYIYGIHYAQLFVWTNIFYGTSFSLAAVLPRTIALFNAYKRMCGVEFRQTNWALAIKRNDYCMARVLNAHDLGAWLCLLTGFPDTSPEVILQDDKIALCAMMGIIAQDEV